ncbi:uncharacterized protein LOC117513104 [Thalassophryne amazonica]|uniref:uncharacterized protein LOC117513104 n=1 Tax=Thalassophryne amazonica TaxID=390379 RepID=UPI001471D2A1|nr:uncharacterized protein LOC117513104 [Thalassophryne amazonica]
MAEFEVFPEVDEDCNETLKMKEQTPEAECNGDDIPTTSQDARRSQRVRTFTEKGQELHDDQVKKATHCFSMCYEKWKAVTKEAKRAMDGQCSTNLLHEYVTKVTSAANTVFTAYDDVRRISSPDNDTRRRMDTCEAVTRTMTQAEERSQKTGKLEGKGEEEAWKGAESVFKSVASSKRSERSSRLKSLSCHSSRNSSRRQEAAAEVAANEAALKVLLEQENKMKEIERQEAEIAQKQRELVAKRREVERLETIKVLEAAKARQQVYEQSECSDEEIHDLLHQHISDKENEVKSTNYDLPLRSYFAPTNVNPTQEVNTTELVKAFAESLSASRLPVPEPTIFSGDPLRYNDWKISFQTLIDRKGIPAEEKTYYLRKYVSGPARKAIESYFLLGTESAYYAAWSVLEERYGNQFLIAKAFRDKLDAWPKISSKGSVELQEYADFLRSCNAAMSQIKGLEVLNDCNENQKMLAKLPDWLTSSWNRKVTELQEQSYIFPSFSHFVEFISHEGKIASLYALKPNESDRSKMPRNRSHGAKVMAVNSNERSTNPSCIYCEKAGHSLHRCFKFMNENIGERLKFIQEKKLCFGCLKSGHRSKDCDNRETCDTCKKKHPTCLHDTRTKEERTQTKSNQAKSSDKIKQKKSDSNQDTNVTQATN